MIAWLGNANSFERKLLGATGLPVMDIDSLELLEEIADDVQGVCVEGAWRKQAATVASLNDGLAKAVGFSDTLARAGVPGYFGFASRVYGIVEAVRESRGKQYFENDQAAVIGSGPDAWAALAAFTQLRVNHLVAYIEPRDALTQAVAHRLGITLETHSIEVAPQTHESARLILDARIPDMTYSEEANTSLWKLVSFHTLATQLRVLTSAPISLDQLREAAAILD